MHSPFTSMLLSCYHKNDNVIVVVKCVSNINLRFGAVLNCFYEKESVPSGQSELRIQ